MAMLNNQRVYIYIYTVYMYIFLNINSSMLYTHHIQRLFILNTRLGRRPWDSAARIQEGQRIWATSEECIYQICLAKKKGTKNMEYLEISNNKY